MKNLILTLISVTSLFFASSCSKNTNSDYPLNGTTWVHNDITNHQVGTLKFSETTFSLYYTWEEDGEQKTNGGTGTYTYANPIITFTVNGGDTETAVLINNTITTSTEVFQKQ